MKNVFAFQVEPFEFHEDYEWAQVARTGVAAPFRAKYQKAPTAAKTGMSPEKVCWIQNALNKTQGERLAADGIYGPLTREAVRRFQARHSLSVDGIVGPQTETALIQAVLNQIAQASLVSISGVMDARTRQEIIRFQSENGLVADGIVGPKTRAAMVIALGGQYLRRPSYQKQPTYQKQPKPPKRVCRQDQIDRWLAECEQKVKECRNRCETDMNFILGKIKEIPGLISCLSAGHPAAITACALAIVGPMGVELIDEYFHRSSCLKNCDEFIWACQHNARRCIEPPY